MRKAKVVPYALINWFTMKNARHNRALKDMLGLAKTIEDFFARYRLQEDMTDFKSVFTNIGQVRIDATEIAYQTGIRINRARNIEGRDLIALVEDVYNDLEEMKRSLYTRTLSTKTLRQRVLKLDMSFESLLAAISEIEYK
ncbi:hypothetical protein ACFLW4_06670 [Chloroflexota bacterium]